MELENKIREELLLAGMLKEITIEAIQKERTEIRNAVEKAYNALTDTLTEAAQKGLSAATSVVKFEVSDDKLLMSCCQLLKQELLENGLTSVTYNAELKPRRIIFHVSWAENQSAN